MKEMMKNLKIKMKVSDVMLFALGAVVAFKGDKMLKIAQEGKRTIPYTVLTIGSSVASIAVERVLDRNFKPAKTEASEK